MKCFVITVFVLFFVLTPAAFAQETQKLATDRGTLLISMSTDPDTPKINDLTRMKIEFINPNTNNIQEHIDYKVTVTRGSAAVFGPIPLTHTTTGVITIPVEFRQNGEHQIRVDVEGILFQPIPLETVTFTKVIGEAAAQPSGNGAETGGCLIATAAYGTELAPQVQLLREVRDNVLLSTNSGTSFMTTFNAIYYAFSPTVADWERQSPLFKDIVRVTITPMLSTLSILSHVGIDSEQQVLGYGIGLILLNLSIYFVAPAIIIMKLRRK